mmetsp:Transcript_13461/g.20468  ORF Transcript_13461/g.20468 Transcript_13461/m.20468 type:complete len:797 (-) Transcript_13461:270-2660(-)|eukprot:CAMPEP_0196804172 /NCGR_PEP_ID=MMETSP1362-20130617/3716_1 /TAXON_ID=163516 /ORGANISM="Leptocylindrus danicus, Strain CCMP1856" /LENGTH=796 /DNA_ID=CAMNT_0042176273 /DNA_START=95 /DNA_END=2485 /DNA_ORIENTATION=+
MKMPAAILALFLLFESNSAFTTTTPSAGIKSIHAASTSSTPWVRLMAQTEQLTPTEEEILFGDSGDVDSLKTSSRAARHVSSYGNLLPSTSPLPELDHSQDPLVNKLRKVRETINNIPSMWSSLAEVCPNYRAILDEHHCDDKVDLTFEGMREQVYKSAAVFQKLGVEKGVNVAILGENSANWLIVDHGIQLVGGASAVRGADAPLDELRYIYEHSDSKQVAVLQGPKLLKKLLNDAEKNDLPGIGLHNDKYGGVKTVVLMHREKMSDEDISALLPTDSGIEVVLFSNLLNDASPIDPKNIPVVDREDLSTIVYTSGTTGRPKGVMLTHANLIHQLTHRLAPSKPFDEAEPLPGDTMLSLLPVWHITERTFEIWQFSRGCSVVYSSIRSFKNDLAKHQPQWMVLVPRVLEKVALGVQGKFASGSPAVKALVKLFTATGTLKCVHSKIAQGLVVGDSPPGFIEKVKSNIIVAALAPLNAVGDKLVWSKVKEGFGGKQKVIISGGSALAGSLEAFYELCGINVAVGYGLTECSPIISYRRTDNNLKTAGCVGKPPIDTELRVVDPEASTDLNERASLPAGTAGVVLVRGPQVMKGYFKNPEATNKEIDRFGWFNTGDLGRVNPATGDLILTGRCKDTIVLSNGENVEPSPIEDAIMSESPLIEQIMLTGQDGRRLTAIVVLNPSELGEAGYLDSKVASALQKQSEIVNDPKCSPEDCEESCRALEEASVQLRSNKDLEKAILSDMTRATSKGFQPWEKVSNFYLTLEPFAMANGLLTQSFKVKRNFVADKFQDNLLEV